MHDIISSLACKVLDNMIHYMDVMLFWLKKRTLGSFRFFVSAEAYWCYCWDKEG